MIMDSMDKMGSIDDVGCRQEVRGESLADFLRPLL